MVDSFNLVIRANRHVGRHSLLLGFYADYYCL
jgi:hypothetical protein